MARPMLYLAALAVGALLGGACLDEDLTLNAECINGDDCASTQTCSRTAEQVANDLNGWCRPTEQCEPLNNPPPDCCAAGEQPGCICDAGSCSSSFDGLTLEAVPACEGLSGTELETCREGEISLTDCVCLIVQPGSGT